jgi:hypothetical protein
LKRAFRTASKKKGYFAPHVIAKDCQRVSNADFGVVVARERVEGHTMDILGGDARIRGE